MHSNASPSEALIPLGNLLWMALNQRGLSSSQAAKQIPMDQGQLSRILNGNTDPTWSTVCRILGGLHISFEELGELLGREARAS